MHCCSLQAGPASADDDDEEDEKTQELPAAHVPVLPSNTAAKKSRKAKKKKKKGALHTEQEDAAAHAAEAQDDEDLDKILAELNIQSVRQLISLVTSQYISAYQCSNTNHVTTFANTAEQHACPPSLYPLAGVSNTCNCL